MVPAESPVIPLVQGPPRAQPFVVLLFAVVGLIEVLQTKPLTVTVAPPLEVTVPLPVAVVWVMFVTGLVVVTVGATELTEQEVYVYVPDNVPDVHVLV